MFAVMRLVLGAPNNLVQFAHGMAGIVLKNDRSLITISVVTICKTTRYVYCIYFDNGPKYQTVKLYTTVYFGKDKLQEWTEH